MIVYSHRGESKYAPENTMSAFYLADLINSNGIETDIRKTKDNKLVLIHDKLIDRISNGKGKVSDYTYEELLNFDFGDKKYKGEKIVTLSEFLKYFSNKNINIFLEIKESDYEKLIYDCISKYNLNNVALISFKYEVLEVFRKLSDKLKLGYLVYDINNNIINESLKINIEYLLCNSISLTKNNVKLAKENNFIVGAWGVKNKAEIQRLKKIDIDILIYDSAYDAIKVLNNE